MTVHQVLNSIEVVLALHSQLFALKTGLDPKAGIPKALKKQGLQAEQAPRKHSLQAPDGRHINKLVHTLAFNGLQIDVKGE